MMIYTERAKIWRKRVVGYFKPNTDILLKKLMGSTNISVSIQGQDSNQIHIDSVTEIPRCTAPHNLTAALLVKFLYLYCTSSFMKCSHYPGRGESTLPGTKIQTDQNHKRKKENTNKR
jgi:hypothetical protein